MSQLQISARLKIHPGKVEAFKATAKACLACVREKEKDALQYDWFFNQDETECVVRETYADSDALLAHIGGLGDLMGDLLASADIFVELYGKPSEALVQACEGMAIEVFDVFQTL
jgi:quinol monooxygenase YgiN